MNKQDEYKQTENHPSILYLHCRTPNRRKLRKNKQGKVIPSRKMSLERSRRKFVFEEK